jgi:hypothetical protein
MGVAFRVQHGGMTDGIRKYAERTLQAGLRSSMRRPDAYKPRSATEAVGGTMRTRIFPIVAELLLRAGREERRIAQNSSRHLGSRSAVWGSQ